jgi:hypothetical protein
MRTLHISRKDYDGISFTLQSGTTCTVRLTQHSVAPGLSYTPPHDATCATRTAFNCRENHAGGENGYTYESLTTGLTNLIMS